MHIKYGVNLSYLCDRYFHGTGQIIHGKYPHYFWWYFKQVQNTDER